MANVYIQKRGKYYQYQFQIASIDGKRKYINKCGFKIVEYYNKYHPDPNQTVSTITNEDDDDDMFRFEKSMDQ